MELQIVVPGNTESAQILNVSDQYFAQDFNEPLVHQVVVSYLAAGRQGTHAQKTRSEVRGGGKKPWKQKGTGRARAGTIRSPIWRGGGVTFAACTGDYSQKVNKKMYKGAMRSILSELIRQDRLIIVDSIPLQETKTKALLAILNQLSLSNVLIVPEIIDEKLYYAARNIKHVEVIDAVAVDPVSLIKYEKVLMTTAAVKMIEERVA